jgi:branched-subunit amino acid ABC-type transport system permease component
LLPATIYEVYRTEGKSTKLASWGMLAVLIGELLLIIFNIDINIAEFLQQSQGSVGGYTIPFGNIQVLAPTLLGVLSVILMTKTWGKYTTWLAIINLVGAFAIVYILDPTIFTELIRTAVKEGMQEIE